MGEKKDLKSGIMPTRVLPKNYRQIGEPGNKKIYVEDYVHTYLNKLAKPGNIYARGAILFGTHYKTEQGTCLFISGACACQNFEFDLENSVITEEVWKEIYRLRDQYFEGLEVVGWFLSRMGFSVGLNDKIIKAHMDNFGGENKVLYLVDALEHEDAFYQMESFSLKKQNGYYLYYEANEAMKNYMLAEYPYESELDHDVEEKTLNRDAAVLRNYRKLLKQKKKIEPKQKNNYRPVAIVGSTVAVVVLLYSITLNHFAGKSLDTASVFLHQEKGGEKDTENIEIYTEEITTELVEEDTFTSTFSEEEFGGDEIVSEEDTYNIEETQRDTEQTTENTSIFSQEEPDEVTEAWSYIGNYYTVQKGDTLAGISKKIYQTDEYVLKIAEKNGIININEIYPGQVLYIPAMND